jgi:hypothetical protein
VNGFDAEGHGILQPVDYPFGECRGKLPGLLETQTVHVEDDYGAIHLGFGLQHGSLQK